MADNIDYEPPEDDGEVLPPEEQLKRIQESLAKTTENLNSFLRTIMPSIYVFVNSVTEKMQSISNDLAPLITSIGNIISSLLALSDFSSALNKLADVQYVWWDYLSDEFIDEINSSDNVNKILRLYNERDKYRTVFETIEKCKHSPLVSNKRLLEQAEFSFKNGKNDIAVLGLTALIDDALTLVSGDFTTSIYNRAKPLIEKLENDENIESDEYAILVLLVTFEKTMKSFSTDKYKFDKPEPSIINRHWIMHGRSHKRKTKLDCIKLINFLYGIILLDELSND